MGSEWLQVRLLQRGQPPDRLSPRKLTGGQSEWANQLSCKLERRTVGNHTMYLLDYYAIEFRWYHGVVVVLRKVDPAVLWLKVVEARESGEAV